MSSGGASSYVASTSIRGPGVLSTGSMLGPSITIRNASGARPNISSGPKTSSSSNFGNSTTPIVRCPSGGTGEVEADGEVIEILP